MSEGLQPIIVKRVKKVAGGHHGGAWKVAYADFVTAMMAFFLLLWLLNAVTQEQLEGIADHFSPTTASKSQSGSGGVLGGTVMAEKGAMTAKSSRSSVQMDLPPPRAGTGGSQASDPTDDAVEKAAKKKEQEQFEKAEKEIREKMEENPAFKRLAKSLVIDNTPEGLRIQVVDQEGLAMFPSGGAKMYTHTRRLLELVVQVINKMPQKLAISGHTDSKKFVDEHGYGNWELSADRANATRRALGGFGVPESRIGRVVGKAATEPLVKEDPEAAKNRRLSIILLRGTGPKERPAKKEAQETGPRQLPGLAEIKKKLADQEKAIQQQTGQ